MINWPAVIYLFFLFRGCGSGQKITRGKSKEDISLTQAGLLTAHLKHCFFTTPRLAQQVRLCPEATASHFLVDLRIPCFNHISPTDFFHAQFLFPVLLIWHQIIYRHSTIWIVADGKLFSFLNGYDSPIRWRCKVFIPQNLRWDS